MPGAAPTSRGRQPGWAVAALHVVALALAVLVFVLTAGWTRWSIGPLAAIAAFAVGSDLTSVETGSSKIKVSGMSLGTVLIAIRLGPAPAAAVGVLTIAVGWLRWREAPHYFRNNLVTFVWFPLASALFFHAAARLFNAGQDDAAYYLLVLPTFAIAIGTNFFGVAVYQCYIDGSSFTQKVREALVPLLSAHLFSAVLTVVALFFVVKTGTVGIVLLALTLAIFQYLVGELLTSQRRGEELQRRGEELQRRGEELQRRATTDELTGLANWQRFRAAVNGRIEASRSTEARFAVMLLDLDRFKEINDVLGHHYGDALLRDLGPRLAAFVGSEGIVARLGGDEFAVVPARGTDDPHTLAGIAAGLIDRVTEPFVVDDSRLEVGASIGISRYPLDGEDVHSLLRRADVAMYAAKGQHLGHQLYEAELDRHSGRRLTVLSDFRRALASDEFVIHYQPIVEIDGSRLWGAEALVRWQHRELGLLPPAQFVPIAEQSGLIGPLSRHVLDRSIAQCAQWRTAGEDLIVAVNLSVRDLLDRDLPRHVEQLLHAYGLPADRLQLEITEGMIMSDPDGALMTVMRLCKLGARVAIDDFGTGYSSLANLKRLPINELKIDRSFIGALSHDESDVIIVRSTINLGHDLGLNVTAEGVEDELTLGRLAKLGCDLAQGYHISPPLSADAFEGWLGLSAGAALEPDALSAQARATARGPAAPSIDAVSG
jgi:diguanylate cyclase (GGDEF)-like protein